VSADPQLVARATRNVQLLRKLNMVVLCVAVVVYVGLLGIALFQGVGPLAVFSTCVMLAELLVFQIVRTLSDHLDIIRNSSA
jgi:hypothetical protein